MNKKSIYFSCLILSIIFSCANPLKEKSERDLERELNDKIYQVTDTSFEDRLTTDNQLEDLILDYPENAELYAMLGYFQTFTGDEIKSIQNLSKAINLKYDYSIDLLYVRGYAKKRLGDKIGANKDFSSFIKKTDSIQKTDWESAWNWYKIGRAYQYYEYGTQKENEQKLTKSYDYYSKAIDLFKEKETVGPVAISRAYMDSSIMPSIIQFNNFRFEGDWDFLDNVTSQIGSAYREGLPLLSQERKYKKIGFEICSLMSERGELGYTKAYDFITSYCGKFQ